MSSRYDWWDTERESTINKVSLGCSQDTRDLFQRMLEEFELGRHEDEGTQHHYEELLAWLFRLPWQKKNALLHAANSRQLTHREHENE